MRLLHRVPHVGLLIALLPLVVRAQTSTTPPSPPPPPAVLSADAAREDIDVLIRALQEAHGGYARFAPRAQVDARLATHKARIAGDIDMRAFRSRLAQLVAELRDGHLRLEYDAGTAAQLAAGRLLPLRLSLEGDDLVVVVNETRADTLVRPGMVVTSLNGRSARDLVAALLPLVAGDGFIETGRRMRLARTLLQLYWLHIAPDSLFALELRDRRGRTHAVTLAGVTAAERAAQANPVNAPVRATLARVDSTTRLVGLDQVAPDVARLRIRAFDGPRWTQEVDSAMALVRSRGVRGLVLDLRGNGGGVDEYGAHLVGQFLRAPFRYFDYINLTTVAPSFATWKPSTFESTRAGTTPSPRGGFDVLPSLHRGVAEQQPASEPFTGTLVVLIDGGSFSTTADVAAQLRSHKRAVFVGEETAGTYEGNSSGLNAEIRLPHSGVRVKVNMYGYWNAVRPVPGGRGIVPEVPLMTRVADLLDGNDPALARAIALARQQ
ncbi:MAG: S41 family peptidase [Gemmatimonadetes bacterium]|nr:S41 family peptidase [Gemmatimonadota bacterium]